MKCFADPQCSLEYFSVLYLFFSVCTSTLEKLRYFLYPLYSLFHLGNIGFLIPLSFAKLESRQLISLILFELYGGRFSCFLSLF